MLQNAHTVVWFVSPFANAFKIKDDSIYSKLTAIKSYFWYDVLEKEDFSPS